MQDLKNMHDLENCGLSFGDGIIILNFGKRFWLAALNIEVEVKPRCRV